MSDLPTITQIDMARTPLETAAATGVAIFYMHPYAPQARTDMFRRLYVKHLEDAARALGMELVSRPALRVVPKNEADIYS